MIKRYVSISITILICLLLCSCGQLKSGNTTPVQESERIDIPINDNEPAVEDEEKAEQQLTEESKSNTDVAENLGENVAVDAESTTSDDSEAITDDAATVDTDPAPPSDDAATVDTVPAPPSDDAATVDTVPASTSDVANESNESVPDNAVGQTVYDPYELPED